MSDIARKWLAEHTAGQAPVFLQREIPPDVLHALSRADLVINIPGGVTVIRSPGDDADAVIGQVLWSIVAKLTSAYAPAVVERDSAVRLYLGRTDPGPEIRLRQAGQTRWRNEIAPGVVLRVERGVVAASALVQVGEANIPVDTPARVLLSLPIGFLREGGLLDVTIWLKSLVLVRSSLVEAYRENPRPVVLKRFEDIARDVGNERLANLLGDVIASEQPVRIGRDRTGVGRELIVPSVVTDMRTTRQPWLDRLQLLIHDSKAQISGALELRGAREPKQVLSELLVQAKDSKAYDAYHSSSIEGYRLKLEEVSSLLGGGAGKGPTIEDVRARLAIVGYGAAFDALLARIGQDEGNLRLSGNLALDLYTDLFAPSVEAGLVDPEALRSFRNSPAHIRNTLFVPPNADKVPAMIDLLFEELETIPVSEGMLRAILVHLWFVWIHPFPDGNGRVARFLMNAALLAAREPWLTIRVEQRSAYFNSLKRAQLEEDYIQFTNFIAGSAEAPT